MAHLFLHISEGSTILNEQGAEGVSEVVDREGGWIRQPPALKIFSATCLRGSWWLAENAPRDLLEGKFENQLDALERGNELVLEKKGGVSDFPAWATRYFANPRHYFAAAEGFARAAAAHEPSD